MSIVFVLGTIAGLGLATTLSVVLVRFNRKRFLISRAAAAASDSQLDDIYALVERTGTVASMGYVLARTNRRIDDVRCLIPVPAAIPEFPWAGKIFEIRATEELAIDVADATAVEPSLLGDVYRPVQIPRHQPGPSVSARNAWAPEKYIADSPALNEQLKKVCPEYPAELLAYLLCVGSASFEFEPINQIRIGANPAWVQDPEPATCDICSQRMVLVLQLPGTTVSKRAYGNATIFLFGCLKHPDQTKIVEQFS